MKLDSQKVRIEIARKGQSMREFAQEAGIPESTIYKALSGSGMDRTQHDLTVVRIADGLGVDIKEVIEEGRTGDE